MFRLLIICACPDSNPSLCCPPTPTPLHTAINQRWESFVQAFDDRGGFVQKFAVVVSLFQDKVIKARTCTNEIQGYLQELESCPFDLKEFRSRLAAIQQVVDKLSIDSFSNLEKFVSDLDGKIESVLGRRLEASVTYWIAKFEEEKTLLEDSSLSSSVSPPPSSSSDTAASQSFGKLVFPPLHHELKLKNQMIYLDPPVEMARVYWIDHLHGWMSHVCQLERIQSTRYKAVASQVVVDPDTVTFRSMVGAVC